MKGVIRLLFSILIVIGSYVYIAFLFRYVVIGSDYWAKVAYSIMVLGATAFPLVILTMYADEVYRKRLKQEEKDRIASEEAKVRAPEETRV